MRAAGPGLVGSGLWKFAYVNRSLETVPALRGAEQRRVTAQSELRSAVLLRWSGAIRA